MANGFPYAIAAQIAYPDRQVVAFVGDGGFSMLMAELSTCVKYKLPIKVVIIKNNTLGQIKWEQMVFLGNPEYGCELAPIDFAAFARVCGGSGFTVEEPGRCGAILDEALVQFDTYTAELSLVRPDEIGTHVRAFERLAALATYGSAVRSIVTAAMGKKK